MLLSYNSFLWMCIPSISFAKCSSSFNRRINPIIVVCTNKKMVWFYAFRVVAMMTNK